MNRPVLVTFEDSARGLHAGAAIWWRRLPNSASSDLVAGRTGSALRGGGGGGHSRHGHPPEGGRVPESGGVIGQDAANEPSTLPIAAAIAATGQMCTSDEEAGEAA